MRSPQTIVDLRPSGKDHQHHTMSSAFVDFPPCRSAALLDCGSLHVHEASEQLAHRQQIPHNRMTRHARQKLRITYRQDASVVQRARGNRQHQHLLHQHRQLNSDIDSRSFISSSQSPEPKSQVRCFLHKCRHFSIQSVHFSFSSSSQPHNSILPGFKFSYQYSLQDLQLISIF